MVYSLTYRRPSHQAHSSRDSISGAEKQRSIDESIKSGSSGMSHGIPDALSFDRIIAGGVCPPCTVRDFMNYLKYIERSAENLQFYLWFQDYRKRFEQLPQSERSLSPEWTIEQAEAEAAGQQGQQKRVSPETAAVFKDTDFANAPKVTESEKINPFYTPPRTPSSEMKRDVTSMDINNAADSTFESVGGNTQKTDYTRKAQGAFEEAGMKWQPLTIQPYRNEITRIISIYVADGGSRQLNLSSKERTSLLHALQNTTHPSAFREVAATVEWSLRCQAHPNFIRWTICNGNRARVIFARGLGVGGIVAGIIVAVILCLSSASRAWRVLAFIGFMIGVATLIAAWKGMCVVLHGMHHRHLRPWELFAGDDEQDVEMTSEAEKSKTSFQSDTTNSWEDEPWVARYEKRNVVRKVFDREVWIQEPALRQIQDTIFLQAMLGAFVISCVATGIFCAFPKGNFF